MRSSNDLLPLYSANCHPYGHIESVALPVEREGLPVPFLLFFFSLAGKATDSKTVAAIVVILWADVGRVED